MATVTAIRNADQTKNPATPPDATWLPLGDTPMHPEYPCAHCITSAAVAAVLQGVVGNEVGEITLDQPDRTRDHPQVDAAAGLQRRGCPCPDLCWLPLPFFSGGWKRDGQEDRRAGDCHSAPQTVTSLTPRQRVCEIRAAQVTFVTLRGGCSKKLAPVKVKSPIR